MYIINVIPLIKIPRPNSQVLSYFFADNISQGALVKILIRKKQINALVISSENLEKRKMDIKKVASFKLRPIEKVISKEPVLTKNQFKLLFWIAEYYFAPLGLVAKIFLSKKFKIQSTSWRTKFMIQNLILTPQTKSLVFAPFKNLKSITLKNEESPLYRSWGRKPYYDARKIAIQLAKIHKARLVQRSDLPTIETYYWTKQGKHELKIDKFKIDSKFKIKNLKLIDLRQEIKDGNYSIISRELQTDLTKSNKSILYISRRGTATFILCRDCGHVVKCVHCDVPMVYHENSRLICHHCGYKEKPPSLCPNCRGYRIKCFGAGTQKVEAEVKKLLPDTKIFRLDSDTARTPEKQQEIINKFNQAKSAILIGTQMLLEKNIKPADLVGLVSIETILNLPDYRSSERVFRILNHLKLMCKKEFIIQTYNPEIFAIKAFIDNDFKKFYDEEIKTRKIFDYPPFFQIIKLTFEHKNPEKAENEAGILLERLKTQVKFKFQETRNKIQVLGPVPAFISRVAGKYRWNIILKSKIKNLKTRNRLLIIIPSTWSIEVDPESLL